MAVTSHFKNWALQDWANLAQLVGLLGLPLSIVLWFFTRAHFDSFWQKWRRTIFWSLVIACATGAAFRGWLSWLGIGVKLPIWALIVGLTLTGSVTFVLIRLFVLIERRKHQQATLDASNYTTDIIFNVEWTWTYKDNFIHEPQAFCPRQQCRARMDVSEDFFNRSTTLTCPNCAFRQTYQLPRTELKRRVEIEIERRVRTGEFLKPAQPATCESRG